MAYLKPKSPIKNSGSGDYIYPLTTIDQIIKSDGSRLGSADGKINLTASELGLQLQDFDLPSLEGGQATTALSLNNGEQSLQLLQSNGVMIRISQNDKINWAIQRSGTSEKLQVLWYNTQGVYTRTSEILDSLNYANYCNLSNLGAAAAQHGHSASDITSGMISAAVLPGATTSNVGVVKIGSNLSITAGVLSLTKNNVINALGYTPPTVNTTYSAGAGINISNNEISNGGVRSISTGATKGTISVNTNGTAADVAVKGLGSNAYTSTAYLPLTGGTLSGALTVSSSLTATQQITGPYICAKNNGWPQVSFKNASNADLGMIFINTGDGTVGSSMYFRVNKTADTYGQVSVTSDGVLFGAAWNDYAEFRSGEITEPGRVVHECKDGIMRMSTKRLEPACEIISDTFGFAIGETEECKTPIAATGRVLAYTDNERSTFELGDAVCSGPNGTVSKMTREEIMTYPERIIGTVSEIPEYETWGTGNVKVNGRIWIRVK